MAASRQIRSLVQVSLFIPEEGPAHERGLCGFHLPPASNWGEFTGPHQISQVCAGRERGVNLNTSASDIRPYSLAPNFTERLGNMSENIKLPIIMDRK